MNRTFSPRLGLWLAVMLSGCASGPDTVVFVTKTSLGVDVEQTPPSASIAYDRVEGYFGPRFDTGAVPPVVASFTTNGQLLDRSVQQVFATGDAARLLVDAQAPASTQPEPELKGGFKPMFFGTSTTMGVKVGFEAGGSTSTFTLGYKRKELSMIPVTQGVFPSVLATLQNDIGSKTVNDTRFGVGQMFATGSAAAALARRPEIRDVFTRRAEDAIGSYRAQERQQSRHALVTLSCLAGLDDSVLPKVWANAAALGVFDKEAKVEGFAAMKPAVARDNYTRFLNLLNADSADTTVRMNLHRQYVCGLAGR